MNNNPLQLIWRWVFILAMAFWVGSTIGSSMGSLWAIAVIVVLAMVAINKGQLERMMVWYIIVLVFVHFIKRLLFVTGSAPMHLYYQVQALPFIIMAVLLFMALKRLGRMRLIGSDVMVGLFFLLGSGITMVRAVKEGSISEGFIALTRNSGATLCYFIGRTLDIDVWRTVKPRLILLFWICLAMGAAQFILGPLYIDIQWALNTFSTSIEAAKVWAAVHSREQFRPYATFADPLGWGFFITFVWSVIEANKEETGENWLPKMARRIFFIACLSLSLSRSCLLTGIGMLFFSWVMQRWLLGRPLVLLAFFTVLFGGVVVLIQYLLENVITASWFPAVTSNYLSRFIDIGTLTQRGYAIEELWRAIEEYRLVGVGWLEQQALTGGKQYYKPLFESHNGIISLLIVVGIPGVLLVIGWFVSWLNKVTAVVRSHLPQRVPVRWASAMILGYVSTTFFSGPQFMNEWFWLMVGWSTTIAVSSANNGPDTPAQEVE